MPYLAFKMTSSAYGSQSGKVKFMVKVGGTPKFSDPDTVRDSVASEASLVAHTVAFSTADVKSNSDYYVMVQNDGSTSIDVSISVSTTAFPTTWACQEGAKLVESKTGYSANVACPSGQVIKSVKADQWTSATVLNVINGQDVPVTTCSTDDQSNANCHSGCGSTYSACIGQNSCNVIDTLGVKLGSTKCPGFTPVICSSYPSGFVLRVECASPVESLSCDVNSCSGHGTCSQDGKYVKCACSSGWTGSFCNSRVVDPTSTPESGSGSTGGGGGGESTDNASGGSTNTGGGSSILPPPMDPTGPAIGAVAGVLVLGLIAAVVIKFRKRTRGGPAETKNIALPSINTLEKAGRPKGRQDDFASKKGDKLPQGWEMAKDKNTKQIYFFNVLTNERSETRPDW